MSFSRRTFLQQVSAATAVALWPTEPSRALWRFAPSELVPEPDEALLRQLALTAVEAARAAGATFADARVTAGRHLWFAGDWNRAVRPGIRQWPALETQAAYGVRALVNGMWGFAGGSTLTAAAVAEVAQTAVRRARAYRSRAPQHIALAPAPRVEQGQWATPIVQDPFTVPLGEQADLALAALTAAEGVRGATVGFVSMSWVRQHRVFASSEGSLIVQRLAFARPFASASGRAQDDHELAHELVETLRRGGYGYEAVSGVDLVAELRQAAERAVANSRPRDMADIPSTEVGRYDLVFGPRAVASLLRMTLAEALNLERALGYRANREGTSFAAPPADILGQYQVASPLVTLRADRTRPHAFATVGWDDEGVPTGEHTLIQDGVIVDYLTTRQTAVELAPWYASRGEPLGARGCAAGAGLEPPIATVPNLTLEPGPEPVTVDDLIADTTRGFYVDGCFGDSDPQLLSGQFTGGAREIRNGKLGRAVRDFGFQFLTSQFWRQLDALGGAGSMVEQQTHTGFQFLDPFYRNWDFELDGGRVGQRRLDPLHLWFADIRAVPARVRQVNVLNMGRMA